MTVPWMSSGSELIPAHVARPSMIRFAGEPRPNRGRTPFAANDFYAEGDNLVRWTPSQPGMAPYDVWRNSS